MTTDTHARVPVAAGRFFVRRVEDVPAVPMQMDGVNGVSMRLMVGRADGAPTFALRHFTVQPGGNTPRHSHNYEHEVLVVGGTARVECAGQFRDIREGDVLFIPPNTLHQFVNNGASEFRFMCLVPVTFDCGQPTPGS